MKNKINFASAVVLAAIIQMVTGYHGDLTTCYGCSDTPANYMCNWGGQLPNPWHVVCCTPQNPSIFCKPSEKNKCSPSFSQAQQSYFMHCPKVNNTMCGSPSKDMKI